MKEIEAKILEINKNEVEKKLRALGAKKVFDGKIDIRYFDFPGKTLKKRGIILRLRNKGNHGELTVKSNFVRTKGAKTSYEEETPVDFNATRKVLIALGYQEITRSTKHRIEYVFDSVKFEIDKL
ncbi:MAG: CYTH domain-containing protein, partial [Candidatus Uhrbacteria bacterium]|nr:CYTH domain-containing protein [Candidatus Uhrbacteria bacterium]